MKRWWNSEDALIRTTIGLLLFSQPVGDVVLEGKFEEWKRYARKFKEKDATSREKELMIARGLVFTVAKSPEKFKVLIGDKKERLWYPY